MKNSFIHPLMVQRHTKQHQIYVHTTYINSYSFAKKNNNKLHTEWNSLLLPFGCMFLILPLPFFYFFCFPSIALYRLIFFCIFHFHFAFSGFTFFFSTSSFFIFLQMEKQKEKNVLNGKHI